MKICIPHLFTCPPKGHVVNYCMFLKWNKVVLRSLTWISVFVLVLYYCLETNTVQNMTYFWTVDNRWLNILKKSPVHYSTPCNCMGICCGFVQIIKCLEMWRTQWASKAVNIQGKKFPIFNTKLNNEEAINKANFLLIWSSFLFMINKISFCKL